MSTAIPLEVIIGSKEPLPANAYIELMDILQQGTDTLTHTITIDVPAKWKDDLTESLTSTGATVREVTAMGIGPEQVHMWIHLINDAAATVVQVGAAATVVNNLARHLQAWYKQWISQKEQRSMQLKSPGMLPRVLGDNEEDQELVGWLKALLNKLLSPSDR